MVDEVVVEFETIGDLTQIQSVKSWTSYNITRDFFKPADGFTLICEDDRVDQLLLDIQVGQRLQFVVNNCPILVGYVDTVEMSYERGHKGKSLVIHGRDICGILEDAKLYPNLGKAPITTTTRTIRSQVQPNLFGETGTLPGSSPSFNNQLQGPLSPTPQPVQAVPNTVVTATTTTNVVNYQFGAQTTLKEAMMAIFVNGLTPITNLIIDDGVGSLTLSQAVGIGVGGRKTGLTGRGIKKAFQNQIKRLCKPEKNESYLNYARRIMKRAGCFIKCLPGTDNTLVISPPTYNRNAAPPFIINHLNSNNQSNNVHSGKMKVSYKQQPSVIIGEATHGSPTFRKQTFKVVCINELTGYIPGSTSLNVNTAIPNVGQAIGILTTGVPGTGKPTTQTVAKTVSQSGPAYNGLTGYINKALGGPQITIDSSVTTFNTVIVPPTGYYLLPPNIDLYNAINRTPVVVNTSFSRPFYFEDYNSQTPEELMIAVAELMADYQDKFFELEYRMDNHSNNGHVWAPNLMCQVTDQAFSPSNTSIANTYWVQKVNFTKSRESGTECFITLNLPFTHTVTFTNE